MKAAWWTSAIGFPSWNQGWNHQRSFFQENRLKHLGSLEPTYKWGIFWVKLTDPNLSPALPGTSKQVYLLCWDDGLQQVGGAAFLSGVPGTEEKSYADFWSGIGRQMRHLNKNMCAYYIYIRIYIYIVCMDVHKYLLTSKTHVFEYVYVGMPFHICRI